MTTLNNVYLSPESMADLEGFASGPRLNLLIGDPANVRSGYTNVDPLAPDGDPAGRVRCDPGNLDPVVDAGEAVEIVAHDIIDRVPMHQANALLEHWLSKLAHGGTIVLSCVDILEVARSLLGRFITVEQANVLLHGEQDERWRFRQANYTLVQLADTLAGKGLRVQSKRINECRAIVVAQRP